MKRTWVTTSSTNVEAVINPLIAACNDGFVPTDLYLIETPAVSEQMAEVKELSKTIIEAYNGETPSIEATQLKEEADFDGIHDHVKGAIKETKDAGGEVAVDVTPGRKFMTAFAFAAGMRYGADRVHYLYLDRREYGYLYPELPRTSIELYDFTEVMA
ncbi:hypothetical protein [Salinibaculum rarum]|uniref:hypothetical protein n=1 Tax=Salinibaculum rarum TaxID=3058903 RepID=UPI00265EF0A3|nr:hypothetical protein [Salinibaculum sp. KK48]